jgi:hypothetical protein
MKIKKFKVVPRLREVYNNLKQTNIKITPEIETLVDMYDKQLSNIISPAVLFETYESKNSVILDIKKYFDIPKNAAMITFIITTLGSEVEEFETQQKDEIKNKILQTLLLEYLDSSLRFVYKILQEQTEENYDLSSIFISPHEAFLEIFKLSDPVKINVKYDRGIFTPKYSSVNHIFWFSKKK